MDNWNILILVLCVTQQYAYDVSDTLSYSLGKKIKYTYSILVFCREYS